MAKADITALVQAAAVAACRPRADAVLAALADASARRAQAAQEIRLLLAYARAFSHSRHYPLRELAQAAGLSVSGARTAYSAPDVLKVAAATGREPVSQQPT